jgi:hypothetical protein
MAYGKSRLENPEVVQLELTQVPKAAHEELTAVSRDLARVANECVVEWLIYHRAAGTLTKLDAKQPAAACPPDFCADVRRRAIELCPSLHYGTMLALTNWLVQTWSKQTSPKFNCKRWTVVLRRLESHWAYNAALPIRLWDGNARLVRGGGEGLQIEVRLTRHAVEGKKNMQSTPLVLELLRPQLNRKRAGGHRLAWLAAAEIADGKRRLSQSQLVHDPRRGKWFLRMTTEGPAASLHAARDSNSVLVIRPGRLCALRIHADRVSGSFGEAALERVSSVRRRLDERRASWSENHDHPGRVATPRHFSDHLAAEWRRKSAAVCDAIVAEVVKSLKDRDFGRVLWLDGDNRTAALARVGLAIEHDARELFPFEQLRRKAEKRLGELGIEVVERANFRSVKRRKEDYRKRLTKQGV